MRIALCETTAHVRQISGLQATESDLSVVALSPRAAWECQLADRAFTRPEDYYCETELSLKTEELVARSLVWFDHIDQLLHERIPAFAGTAFRPALAWSAVLRPWLGEYLQVGQILHRMLEQTRPEEVLYWPKDVSAGSWNLVDETSVYTTLLPQLASHYGARVEGLPELPELASQVEDALPAAPSAHRQAWPELLLSRFAMPAILTAQRYLGGSRLWAEARLIYKTGLVDSIKALRQRTSAQGSVLVIGRGYDLDPVVAALRRRGVQINWLDMYVPGTSHGPIRPDPPLDPGAQAALARLWPERAAQEILWSPFEEWGLGRPSQAECQISYWWHQIIPQLWSGYQRAARTLARRRYDMVLAMDAGGETLSGAMVQAGAAAGIPRIIYQHGSSSRIRPVMWHHFLAHASTFLVYGPGTAQLIEHDQSADSAAAAEVRAVGSARLDALANPTRTSADLALRSMLCGSDPRPLILYIPTHFGSPGRVFSEQTGYPDISYFELQQRVLRLFKRYPGVRLLYKDFTLSGSGHNPIPDFIRAELPDAMIVHDLPLTRLMWAVDAIVIDHAITAIGEVLLTKKRLVVYDPDPLQGTAPPDSHTLLRLRAAVAATPDEFEAALCSLLERGDFTELEQADDSFLRAYCTHLNDGRSAERAADEVMRVMVRR